MLPHPLRGCSCNFCYFILNLVGTQGTSQLLWQIRFTVPYTGKLGCMFFCSVGQLAYEAGQISMLWHGQLHEKQLLEHCTDVKRRGHTAKVISQLLDSE